MTIEELEERAMIDRAEWLRLEKLADEARQAANDAHNRAVRSRNAVDRATGFVRPHGSGMD